MDSKSKEYWNSRIQDVYDEIYDRKTIRKIYRKAYYDVEADIKSLYDSLKDTGDISTTKLYQFERFISLKKELKNQAKYVKSTLDNEVTKTLTQAYKDTFDTVNHMVGKDRTWGVQNDKMVEAAVHKKWQGANFSERIWKDTDELARDVKAAITDCITRGVSKDVYVKQIMKQYNAGFSKADRLVRTELMHTINTAQIETYKMDGVTKVEWYTADDERVCSDCGSMHGRIFDIKEVGNDVEVIAHPNCRCTYLPVIDDIESIEFQTDTVDNSGKSGIIKEEDIKIYKSLGAAAFRDDILLPNGNMGKLKEGSRITKVVAFAGKGTNKELRVAKYLEKEYGVSRSEWKHSRGDGYVVCDDGNTRHAELHWFECKEAGRVKMKVKRYFKDES